MMIREETTIIDNANSPVTSSVVNLRDASDYSVQIVYGNGGGTIKLQGSVDGTTYVDIDSLTLSATADTHLWNVSVANYQYVRLDVTGSVVGVTAKICVKTARVA